ncbi:MAG TPA: hypothetical protein VNT26_17035, partial [Candidatus Sulfotelmatobacter sp.]|nr:hypothetical protein [Candidatus Sulfotelmatobacter sp.]
NSPETTRLIANKAETAANRPGSKVEQDVISRGVTYYGKDKKSVSVTLPMRDRNGEAMAAVRVVMQSFTGQTEQNAVVRAAPIVKEMQARCSSLQDLLE